MEGGFGPAVAPPFPAHPPDPADPEENSGSFILAVKNNDFGNLSGNRWPQIRSSFKKPEENQQESPRWPQGVPWVPQDGPKRVKATPKDGQREPEGTPKAPPGPAPPHPSLPGPSSSRDKHYINKLPINRKAAVMLLGLLK